MAGRRFRGWTQAELEAAAKALEEGLLSGVASISYPAGGSIAYVSPAQARGILADVEDAIAAREQPLRRQIRRVRIRSFGLG